MHSRAELLDLLQDCRSYITPTISTHEEISEVLGWCDCGYCTHVPREQPTTSPAEHEADDICRRVVYLSGPMAGLPEYNHPAFHTAAKQLRSAGFMVLNPADYGLDEKVWATCLRRDLHDLLRAEIVVVLPGWERSKGAMLETDVARRLGMPIYSVDELVGGTMTTTNDFRTLSPVTISAINAATIHAQVKHGDRSYLGDGLTTTERLAGLMEEVGEVARALTYDGGGREGEHPGDKDKVVKELLQVASVAACWAEWLDNKPSA
jgi:uncharacterized protein DUF4406